MIYELRVYQPVPKSPIGFWTVFPCTSKYWSMPIQSPEKRPR
jgi:hypothetical protein